jgi:uncharacterized protein YyaL (SSP411 family)
LYIHVLLLLLLLLLLQMTFVQALTGGGGWPMSVWLTPGELKPFYGGTYYPGNLLVAVI